MIKKLLYSVGIFFLLMFFIAFMGALGDTDESYGLGIFGFLIFGGIGVAIYMIYKVWKGEELPVNEAVAQLQTPDAPTAVESKQDTQPITPATPTEPVDEISSRIKSLLADYTRTKLSGFEALDMGLDSGDELARYYGMRLRAQGEGSALEYFDIRKSANWRSTQDLSLMIMMVIFLESREARQILAPQGIPDNLRIRQYVKQVMSEVREKAYPQYILNEGELIKELSDNYSILSAILKSAG